MIRRDRVGSVRLAVGQHHPVNLGRYTGRQFVELMQDGYDRVVV